MKKLYGGLGLTTASILGATKIVRIIGCSSDVRKKCRSIMDTFDASLDANKIGMYLDLIHMVKPQQGKLENAIVFSFINEMREKILLIADAKYNQISAECEKSSENRKDLEQYRFEFEVMSMANAIDKLAEFDPVFKADSDRFKALYENIVLDYNKIIDSRANKLKIELDRKLF